MESLMLESIISICLIAITGVILLGFGLYWRAVAARRRLQNQGVMGPPPSFFHGNSSEMRRIQFENTNAMSHSDIVGHDYTSSLFPYFEHWRARYGRLYTYSTGMTQHLYINDPELVKELNQANPLKLGRVSYISRNLGPILGRGVITSNGPYWAHQRNIIAPEFFLNKVKGMVGLIAESTFTMLRRWEERIISEEGNIRVDDELREVSADIISRACFGSSFPRGKEIFAKLRCLQKLVSEQGVLFNLNGLRDIIFGRRKAGKISALEKEVESLIWETVRKRERKRVQEKDLMQLILEGAKSSCDSGVGYKMSYKCFVVDNCKSMYFAGHETTAVSATWCLLLLAMNPSWQSLIREEFLQSCPDGIPSADALSSLKSVTMVIRETLRLYPPAAFVSREAFSDTRLGSLMVPKGVCLWTLIPTLHRDAEIWGPDANEFKPERFQDGVSGACKYPQAYVPFGLGPRVCLGKNFAMVELKVLISLLVSRFRFALSPTYQHSPVFRMLVEPQHGVLLKVSRHISHGD